MKYASYTDPAKIRPGTRKHYLYKVYCEQGEPAVYKANAAFGTLGSPFAEPPLKLKTVEGHVRYWNWRRSGAVQ